MRQMVILAGGMGTRLRERLDGRPKPLIEIGGTPLLEHQVLLAKRHGVGRVLLLVNYAADRIAEFCSARGDWGIEVECLDDGEPLGTAGAVLGAFERLDDEFLVVYGDTMIGVDLTRFCAFHRSLPEPAVTLLLHPNDHPQDSDLVEMDEEGRIVAFHPYPHNLGHVFSNLVNAALYVVRRTALAPYRGMRGPLDFGKDLFPDMLHREMPLFGYNSPEYIKDCGTPSRLERVCLDFSCGRIARSSLDVPQAAVFVDRDGTINAHAGLISRAEQLHLLPGAGEAIARLNRSDYRAVVVTNQPVIARGDCTTAELRHIHAMMESLLSADGAYLDRLYYCPHHPDSGFCGEIAALKIACSCRKPNIGLIERAVGELNIALERSWMIGDTTSDMLTARRAGLTSILVETGKAGLDGKFGAHPDFISADLLEAVGFILDEYPLLCARCDEIATTILPGQLVFVGGLSRSGKSTLASALHLALHRQGRQAYVVAADRWLLSADHRSPGVLGRYDLAAMTHAAGILADRDRDTPIEVALPTYDRLLRRRTGNIERLVTDRDDVIIIEGTVALHISTSLKQRGPAFFVETDETLRRVRVIREYRLHGCSEAEAEAIYASRQADEAPVILATASLADCRITLPLMSGRHVGSLYSGDGRA